MNNFAMLSGLSTGQIIRKLLRRVRLEMKLLRDERRNRREAEDYWPHAFEQELEKTVNLVKLAESFGVNMRRSFFIEPDQRTQILEWLQRVTPHFESLILAEAARCCAHEVDLLGSGWVSLGENINWHQDFKSGHSWNPAVYYQRIRYAMYPGGYDIKVPWELSRCQHFIRLGQAYWLTGDPRYGEVFITQLLDWIDSNPWPYGVNWSSTMDVAIRAVNWMWGLAYFLDFPGLTVQILNKILISLWRHGRHIWQNLEVMSDLTTNHYLADLVGLIYIGILLPEAKEAAHWKEFGLTELEREIHKQVYVDGVSFEASTSYHRLSIELFLSATILAQKNGYQFSQSYMTRLEKMVEFIMYLSREDGTVPLIGDQDNGRVHRLSIWEEPDHEWVNFRYLLAIGAVLFNREDFAIAAGDYWQEAIWMLRDKAIMFRDQSISHGISRHPLELTSKGFPEGGIYILRSGDWHLVMDCGSVGLKGLGGHAHNDSLSINFYAAGINWLVDPGSFIYTADYVARNQFRSTAFHNTVVIDGKEQNQFNPKVLFKLDEIHPPEVNTWITEDQFDFISSTHQRYLQSTDRISHERQIYLKKEQPKYLLIQDNFTGTGDHIFSWNFLTGSDHVTVVDNSILLIKNGIGMVIFFIEEHPEIKILPGWRSQSYGRKDRIQVINCTMSHSVQCKVRFLLNIVDINSDWFHETEKIAIYALNNSVLDNQVGV